MIDYEEIRRQLVRKGCDEDIVQETLLKLFTHQASVRNPLAWAKRVAWRATRDVPKYVTVVWAEVQGETPQRAPQLARLVAREQLQGMPDEMLLYGFNQRKTGPQRKWKEERIRV